MPPETALYPRLHAELRAPLTPVQGNPTGTSVTPKPFLLCPSVSCRVKRVDTTGGLRPGGVKPVEATVMMVDARRGQVMPGEENRDRSGDDQTMMKTGDARR